VLDLDVEVTVSSGTYVRALARDLGAALGVGGHLTALRRTRVGAFTVDSAHDLAALAEVARPEDMPVTLLADAARAQFAVRELTEAETTAVGFGQRVDSLEPGREGPVAAFAPDGRLMALLDESGHKARAYVVFAPAGS
jgi:tRNA pseudouridine55 synthase